MLSSVLGTPLGGELLGRGVLTHLSSVTTTRLPNQMCRFPLHQDMRLPGDPHPCPLLSHNLA